MDLFKQPGTAYVDSTAAGSAAANLNDGNNSTVCTSNRTGANQWQGVFGIYYPEVLPLRRVVIRFARWTRYIRFYTWAFSGSAPSIVVGDSPTGRTLVREIDTVTQPLDDAGNPWQRDFDHVIDLNLASAAGIEVRQYSVGNASGPLFDSGSLYSGIAEMALYAELVQTPVANSNYAPEGSIANLTDGNKATYCSSANTYSGALGNDFMGIKFNAPVTVAEIIATFNTWGRWVNLRVWTSYLATPTIANTTFVKLIDTINDVDADGRAFTSGVDHRLPLGLATPIYGFIIAGVGGTSPYIGPLSLNNSGGYTDRMRMFEIAWHDALVPNPITEFTARKLPGSLTPPTAPFGADQGVWKCTSILSPGDNSFTPRPDTTAMFVVGFGGGGGGLITTGKNNVAATDGGDSSVLLDGIPIFTLAGGKAALRAALTAPVNKGAGAFGNWLSQPSLISAGSVGTENAVTSSAGGAGGTSLGAGGTGFTMPAPDASVYQPAGSYVFATTQVPVGFVIDQGGWTYSSANSYRANSSVTGTVSLFMTIKAQVGVTLTFNFTHNLQSSGGPRGQIYVNGALQYTENSLGVLNRSINYVTTVNGDQVIEFRYPAVAAYAGSYMAVTSLVVAANYVIGSGGSGAESRSLVLLNDPSNGPIVFRVGAAGVGSADGITVPGSAVGVNGSGGAGGANGSSGGFYVYETNASLLYELTRMTLGKNAPFASPHGQPGCFATRYVGPPAGASLAALPEATYTFTHRLRPLTKTVYAIVVGPGGAGGAANSSARPSYQCNPTILSSSKMTLTAGGGFSPSASITNGGSAGPGGVPSLVGLDAPSENGVPGDTPATGNKSSGVTGGYGNGAAGNNYINNGQLVYGAGDGSSGAIIMAAFRPDLTDDGVVNITINNAGRGANAGSAGPGAVIFYEFETEFGALVSGNTEMLFIAEGKADVRSTQLPQLVFQQSKLENVNVSGNQQLIFKKDKLADNQISQLAQQVLRKDNDTPELRVALMQTIFVFEDDPSNVFTSQNAELVLTRSLTPAFNITQNAQQILIRARTSEFRFTQTAQLLHIKESPSKFWLRFGVLEYPLKKILYMSDIARATNVAAGTYIQLEGNLPPGSTMIINDVEVGLSSPVKSNDRVQLKAGVMNYFTTAINVYKYEPVNGNINRELVGTWAVTQPVLSPMVTKTYYAKYTYGTTRTVHGLALSSLIPMFVKNLAMYGKLVEALATSAMQQAAKFTAEFTSAKSLRANVDWMVTKAEHQLVHQGDYEQVSHKMKTNEIAGYLGVKTHPELVKFVGVDHLYVADSRFAQYDADYAPAYAEKANVPLTTLTPKTHPELVKVDYEQTAKPNGAFVDSEYVFADYNSMNVWGTILTAMKTHDHLATFKLDTFRDHTYSATAPVSFDGGAKANQALFIYGTMPTIAYSAFTDAFYDRALTQGNISNVERQFDHYMPSGHNPVQMNQDHFAPAGYGLTGISAEFVQRAMFHEFTYANEKQTTKSKTFANAGEKRATGSGSLVPKGAVAYEIARRYSGLAAIAPMFTKAQNGKATLFPTAAPKELVNALSRASTYMGFDTQQAALDFTENFADVVIKAKYNGYVYTLKVDQTFMCEIYSNMPVKGLIQGG